MSKAVLIMDKPKDCYECKLQDWLTCRITKKCNTSHSRPDWCPLCELPKKKPTIGKESENDIICMNAGYNACIDELLGNQNN